MQPLLEKFLRSRSENEDSQRKEFILNTLLLSSMAIFAIAGCINVIIVLIDPGATTENTHLSPIVLFLLFFMMLTLYVLSRKGYFRISAYILVGTFFSFSFFMGYAWGIDVAVSLLVYMLVIVMAGILVNTRFAFIATTSITLALIVVGSLQHLGIVIPNYYWRTQPWYQQDTIMTCILFFVVAIVSWLSNREIERSLRRAHASEAALRAERDSLEVIVEERTRELKETQLEKISQLYSFAEFGRLSSGLFHDLMNPLTAVSLNVERAKSEGQSVGDLSKARQYLDQAFVAAKRMERFITAVRTQIGKHGEKKPFSVVQETRQVIDILSYKAHVAGVALVLADTPDITLVGDPVRWAQALLNLVTNGIDAYDDMVAEGVRSVTVAYAEDEDSVRCTVTDHGVGIAPGDFGTVFKPFFTTKPPQATKGTGIGLSIVSTIVEKDFGGTVTVASTPSEGTVFTIIIPTHN